MFELGPYNNIDQNYAKGPRTLQLKLEKSSYRRYALQLFFATATIFPTVLYMGNDFHNEFLEKLLSNSL